MWFPAASCFTPFGTAFVQCSWLKIQLLISAEEKCVSSQSPTHNLELSGSSYFRHTVVKCGSSYSFLIFCSVIFVLRRIDQTWFH